MRTRLVGTFLALSLFVPSLARLASADVLPPPDAGKGDSGSDCAAGQSTGPCDGKKVGEACTFSNGNAGNCAALRCTNSDGTTMLACVATGAQPPASSSGGSSEGTSTCAAAPARADASGGVTFALGLGLVLAALARKRRA
jgi:hypothetical protein